MKKTSQLILFALLIIVFMFLLIMIIHRGKSIQSGSMIKIGEAKYQYIPKDSSYILDVDYSEENQLLMAITKGTNKISLATVPAKNNFSFHQQDSIPLCSWFSPPKAQAKYDSFSPDTPSNEKMVVKTKLNQKQIIVSGAYPFATIEYDITPTNLKETIVLSSNKASTVYQFPVNFQNVDYEIGLDGNWYFYDISDQDRQKPLFYVPKPFMVDAKGQKSLNVNLNYVMSGDESYFELVADKNWLNHPDRKFPVQIDPTFELNPPSNEIVGMRTEVQKSFVTETGINSKIFINPVHYQDRTGKWKNIDTTFKKSPNPNYSFEMLHAVYSLSVKDKFSSQNLLTFSTPKGLQFSKSILPIQVADNGKKVVISPTANSPITTNNALTFIDVFASGLDVVIEANKSSYDKWLVINSKEDLDRLLKSIIGPISPNTSISVPIQINFTQPINHLFNGLENVNLPNQSVGLSVANLNFQLSDDFSMLLSPPFIIDADGFQHNNISWELTSASNSNALLNFTFRYQDISNLTYPIKINLDTTYYGATGDGYITGTSTNYSTARSTSSSCTSSGTSANVGQARVVSTRNIYRTYLEFDTSGIPDGDTISSSSINMKFTGDQSTTDFDILVYHFGWDADGTGLCDAANQEPNYDGAYGGSATSEGTIANTNGIGTGYYSLAVGTTRISKTAYTRYTVVSAEDVNNSDPTGNEYIAVRTTESTGTTNDPYLDITHASEATPTPTPTNTPTPTPTFPPGYTNFNGVDMNGVDINK